MLRLVFKQRFFSWFDSYDIYDEHQNVVFTVKGQLSLGHCLHIYDIYGAHIGTVKEEIFTLMPRFGLYVGDNLIGQVKKKFTFLLPEYTLECQGLQVCGDVLGWDYSVIDKTGAQLASISKQVFNFTDTYEIIIRDSGLSLVAIMIVLAIDASNCGRN